MSNALQVAAVSRDEWSIMLEQGAMLVSTGFLPSAIKTKEQAVAVMLKGRELHIPSMYALSNIAIIQGKPTANSELMLALIYRDHGDDAVMFTESTAQSCTIAYKRRNWKQRQTFTFTIDDAKQAGVLNNPTWQKYPAAMLRARCISAVARMAYPDTIGGMYTPEELGATVDEDGGLIDVPAAPQPRHEPTPIRAEVEVVDQATGEIHSPEPFAEPVTEAQKKKLFAVARSLGWSNDEVRDVMIAQTGKEHSADLTKREASALIDYLEQGETPVDEGQPALI